MNGLKFNSQVCTDINQSKKLLELGLKPETADMCHFWLGGNDYYLKVNIDDNPLKYNMDKTYIPAWSLHRLIDISEVPVEVCGLFVRISSTYYYEKKDNVYDILIDAIRELINNDVFNRKYLKQ